MQPSKKSRPMSAKSSDYGRRSLTNKSHKPDLSIMNNLQGKIDTTLLYKTGTKQIRLGLNMGETNEVQKYKPKHIQKSPERLYQQNLLLRKRINELENQIRVQRTLIENSRKSSLRMRKKLNVEFEKELYWNTAHSNGEYVVLGIKHEYQKLKQKYNEKCKQADTVRRILKYTQIQQTIVQLEAYKAETTRLQDELSRLINLYKIPNQISHNDSKYNEGALEQLKKSVNKYEYDIEAYENGLRSMNKILKDKEVKINFLEKVIIEKENNIYNHQQSSRKFALQIDQLKNKNKDLKQNLIELTHKHNLKVEEIKANDQKRYQKQITLFQKQLQQKVSYAAELEKQVLYLSTLLQQGRNNEDQSISPANNKNKMLMSKRKTQGMGKKQSAMSNHIFDIEMPIVSNNNLVIAQQQKQKQSLIDKKKSIQNQIMKSKHYSLKRNKVKEEDIKDICEQIKYRLIKHHVSINQAKNYIVDSNSEEISIKTIIDILSNAPFSVQSVDRRIIFARYLVQDETENTLYYNQDRIDNVKVVQSRFERAIPKYKILKNETQIEIKQKIVEMIQKYKQSLTQAIGQYSKQHIISAYKFLQILTQQQLNMDIDSNNFMIGEMLDRSVDISQLDFKVLLDLR